MALAAIRHFTVEQGATWTRRLSITDEAETIINTAGYTARLHIRERKDKTSPLVMELTNANGRIVLGGNPWNVVLQLTATETEALAGDEGKPWHYDLELSGGGVITRELQGLIRFDKEVSG